MSITFDALELLPFLKKKIIVELSHKILNDFEMESKIPSLEMNFLNQSTLEARFEISVFGFYGWVKMTIFGKILVDFLTKILVGENDSKFMEMLEKTSKNDKISKNIYVKLFCKCN